MQCMHGYNYGIELKMYNTVQYSTYIILCMHSNCKVVLSCRSICTKSLQQVQTINIQAQEWLVDELVHSVGQSNKEVFLTFELEMTLIMHEESICVYVSYIKVDPMLHTMPVYFELKPWSNTVVH